MTIMQFENAIQIAKVRGSKPRVHGNGFIQLDVNDGQRLHFWGHPEIPRQTVATPIHDHVFDLISEIYIGRLYSISYGVEEHLAGEFEIFQANPGNPPQTQAWPAQGSPMHPEETLLRPIDETRKTCHRATILHAQICGEGHERTYRHPRGVFHESVPAGPAVSLMTKTYGLADPDHAARPRVLVPRGGEPDNTFRRDAYSDELLWSIIQDFR